MPRWSEQGPAQRRDQPVAVRATGPWLEGDGRRPLAIGKRVRESGAPRPRQERDKAIE